MIRQRRQLFPRGKSALLIATVTLLALTTLATAGCGSKSGVSRDQCPCGGGRCSDFGGVCPSSCQGPGGHAALR